MRISYHWFSLMISLDLSRDLFCIRLLVHANPCNGCLSSQRAHLTAIRQETIGARTQRLQHDGKLQVNINCTYLLSETRAARLTLRLSCSTYGFVSPTASSRIKLCLVDSMINSCSDLPSVETCVFGEPWKAAWRGWVRNWSRCFSAVVPTEMLMAWQHWTLQKN